VRCVAHQHKKKNLTTKCHGQRKEPTPLLIQDSYVDTVIAMTGFYLYILKVGAPESFRGYELALNQQNKFRLILLDVSHYASWKCRGVRLTN
jgi:hypothetical protein